jgi:hypothetical protein
MILLHQHIAYPTAQLSNIVRLPSVCSAETCQLAAIETSSISQKFLTYSESNIVVAQFPFCAFVAARVLLGSPLSLSLSYLSYFLLVIKLIWLVHWKFYGAPLAAEYFTLLQSLRDMSHRWQGYLYPRSVTVLADSNEQKQHQDLAGRYVALLEGLHSKCLNEQILSTEKLFHYDVITGLDISRTHADKSPRSVTASRNGTGNQELSMAVDKFTAQTHNPQSFWGSFSNNMSVPGNELGTVPRHNTTFASVYAGNINGCGVSESYGGTNQNTHAQPTAFGFDGTTSDDELTLMSNVLLDHQFSQMDRVITLDGADFTWEMDDLAANWQNPA